MALPSIRIKTVMINPKMIKIVPKNLATLSPKVVTKNGIDLDLYPENLSLIHTPNFKGNFVSRRPIYSPEQRVQLSKTNTYSQDVILPRAKITCYNKAGIKISTFENIYHAHLQTNIEVDMILNAIAQPFTVLRDCYWRSGKKMAIDTSIIKMQEIQLEKERIGIQMAQFDLNGNPINHYYSITEAATDNKLDESEILECLYGKTEVAGYFMWRKGYWDTPIPGL